jgi:hypothetical protein
MHHLFDTTHVSAVLGMRPIGVIDMSDSMVGMKLAWGHFPPWTGKKPSEEHRINCAIGRTGSKRSEDTKQRMSEAAKKRGQHPALAEANRKRMTGNTIRRGAKISDKSKELMKQSSASRELHECPHCKRMLLMCNLVRWHGDNCKEKQ